MRPRGAGSDPREAAARAHRENPGALKAAILTFAALQATAGCSGGPPPSSPPHDLDSPGYRVLYDARVEASGGHPVRFRLAAAVAPPDRLRLEVLGPAGGTRLVLATDGRRAVALQVSDRRFDDAAATPEALERWTGLRLGSSDLVALLRGNPPCDTTIPEADSATGVGVAIDCADRGQDGWPRQVRVERHSDHRSIDLKLVEGPVAATLAGELFSPVVPEGFARADLLRSTAGASPLLDAGPGGVR